MAAARGGKVLDLAPGLRDDQIDFAAAATWPASRRVPGPAIRQTLLLPELHADPRGLRLRGAHITGEIDLRYANIGCPVEIELSIFETVLDWQDLSCGALRFKASQLRGLDLARTTISGQLDLKGARLSPPNGNALNLDGAQIKNDVLASQLKATGHIRASGATIDGHLDLEGARLSHPNGNALNLDGAEIRGGVFASQLTATGQVRALEATIGGRLDLEGAQLSKPNGYALTLDRAQIKGGVFASQLTATGQVRALEATIDAVFRLEGARLSSPKGNALSLDGVEVKGGVFASQLTATGQVRALHATISGQLDLRAAHLNSPNGYALSLDGAEVKGGVFASQLTATAEVRAVGATIGGQLDLIGAKLSDPKGYALTLDRAEIKGGVFASELTATAEVRAVGATIGGQLGLQGAQLSHPNGDALSLRGATIKGPFALSPSKVEGRLGLQAAQLSNLVSSRTSCLFDTPVDAGGWGLGDVQGPLRTDRAAAARWLDTSGSVDFMPQPWHELANVYDRNGQPGDARWMRYQAAKRTTKAAPPPTRLLRHLYAALVGHGYYPLRAAVWLVGALVLAGVIVGLNKDAFSPTDPSKAAMAASTHRPRPVPAADITAATPCQDLAPTYRCFNAGLYALDTVLPAAVTTGQAADWRPIATGVQTTAPWLPWFLSALKIVSWLTTALLLAGVTGLLRKT